MAIAVMVVALGADAAPRRKAAKPVKERYAAIIMDARTGEVFHQANADAPRHPASITKIMTLYLVFEALERGRLKMDQPLPVSAYASTVPWGLPLRPGMTITVEEAILGLITKSANNAATVIAEHMAGSERAFAQTMTVRARRLGMTSTTFRNASGLPDPRQITTARDFTVLARAMLRDYPKYYPLFATRGFTFRGNFYHNHNRLLDQFEGLDGIKTGFVNDSGFNLVASAERNGRRLIGVVMGGTTAAGRDQRMAELLNAGFQAAPSRRPDLRLANQPVIPPALPELREAATAAEVVAPAPAPPAAPPLLGRSEPLRLVVASNDAAGRLAQAAVAREEVSDSWAVQVGAFSSRDGAGRALRAAQQKAPRLQRDATSSVMAHDDRLYRARFVGLDERDARAVCRQLGERTFPCAVIPPGQSSVARVN
ncbi:D-alanyl-D-alanine carboxypeptidase [Stella sp.]|uniref:D-alanyl-D-alanine carboxypeptidase n=1 Tax=Stella sp. TaxID=2912054 RepID=UPI0035B1F56C